jgi:hypothetical protein
MFDKTFVRFALGFSAIIVLSIGALYFAGYIQERDTAAQTASVR